MTQQPYSQARRVFWIVDNGSSHRGQASVERFPQATLNWSRYMDQFMPVGSTKSRSTSRSSSGRCSRPTTLLAFEAVAERLEQFERYYEKIAQPFEWKFTRVDLNALIARMRSRYAETQHLKLAA